MSTAVIVVTELSHASDAMFSRFLYNFSHVCVEVDGVCVWGEVYAFIILFEFVSYADRNEDMFQLISFFLAFYGFRLHRKKNHNIGS